MTQITINNYEEFALDWIEGTIQDTERKAFEAFLVSHPEIRQEFQEFEMLSLTPDQSIVYNQKERLLKNDEVRVIPIMRNKWYMMAASLLILMVAGWLIISNNQNVNTAEQSFAETEVTQTKLEDKSERKTTNIKEELQARPLEIEEQKTVIARVEEKQTITSGQDLNIAGIKAKQSQIAEDDISRVVQAEPTVIAMNTVNKIDKTQTKQVQTEIKSETNIGRHPIESIQSLQQSLGTIAYENNRLNPSIDLKATNLQTDDSILEQEYFRKYGGKLAFANTSISFVPTYFEQYLTKNKN